LEGRDALLRRFGFGVIEPSVVRRSIDVLDDRVACVAARRAGGGGVHLQVLPASRRRLGGAVLPKPKRLCPAVSAKKSVDLTAAFFY
jgi:hypothetical protein